MKIEQTLENLQKEEKTFRDTVGTMDETGKRKWVFPRKPKGNYTTKRNYTSFVLLLIFFTLPFVKINGNPFLLINIMEGHFFIFGQPFYPQDSHIMALAAVILVIFIMIFTVVFGRLFCGWLCPQTIFMEAVFRKIEYWIEGDRNKQLKLQRQEWDSEKIRKKTIKWSVFLLISILISHFMFMYIVGYAGLFRIIAEGPAEHPANFVTMIIFTGIFYFVFAWLREQVCTLICPYGRLQGVMIDKKTVNVLYDYKRGEGRSKWRNGEDRKAMSKGDCIDCQQCVVVCPTGIDIRNGQQLECINCTACIDACDEVMVKVGLPKGLIRYATEEEIEKQKSFKFTSRMKVSAFVLLTLLGFFGFLFQDRGSMEVKFLKSPGTSYFSHDGQITNTFTYTFLNKSYKDQSVTIKVLENQHALISLPNGNIMKVKGNKLLKGNINISLPEKDVKFYKQNIKLGVFGENGKLLDSYQTIFDGPYKIKL